MGSRSTHPKVNVQKYWRHLLSDECFYSLHTVAIKYRYFFGRTVRSHVSRDLIGVGEDMSCVPCLMSEPNPRVPPSVPHLNPRRQTPHPASAGYKEVLSRPVLLSRLQPATILLTKPQKNFRAKKKSQTKTGHKQHLLGTTPLFRVHFLTTKRRPFPSHQLTAPQIDRHFSLTIPKTRSKKESHFTILQIPQNGQFRDTEQGQQPQQAHHVPKPSPAGRLPEEAGDQQACTKGLDLLQLRRPQLLY